MIPAWIGNYIDLPFEQYNCWQLICKIYREHFHIQLPDYETEYRNHLDYRAIKRLYERELYMDWRKVDKPVFGDCVAIKIKNQPWHCGLIVNETSMLHTEQKLWSVIEPFNSPMWHNNIIGFFHYAKS